MKPMVAGRPPKFDEQSSPITVTLPLRILRKLEHVASDRGKAIVKCVEGFTDKVFSNEKKVEIVKISDKAGMIIIGRCRCLERIPWLRLIEIAPSRFLLSVPLGTSITSLEVSINDLIEHQAADNNYEKELLEELRQCISHHRRQEIVTKGEILFVDLDNHNNRHRSWGVVLPMQMGIDCIQFLADSALGGTMLLRPFC